MNSNEKPESKNFNKPDEERTFPNGKMESIKVNGVRVVRSTLKPGWKWSISNQPMLKHKVMRKLISNISFQEG